MDDRRRKEYGMVGSKEERQKGLDAMYADLERQHADWEAERERSKLSAEAYERRWREIFAAMDLDETIEIPVTISHHRSGRQERTTLRCIPTRRGLIDALAVADLDPTKRPSE